MGIPFYFATLTKKYENIISKTIPQQIQTYCMDFNGVIHAICKKHIEAGNFTEKKLIDDLYVKIQKDISEFRPDQTMICVDGVVPLAKMVQQRKRRYLKVFSNVIDKITPIWDSNAITPGTNFMKQLDKFLKSKLKNESNIYYSGSDEYGEGEHKIFGKLQSGGNIVINGLDADLIILSLMSNKKNIYLMREDKETMFMNIDLLREAILQELVERWDLDQSEYIDIYSSVSNELIESYCVMCSLMGNDFIPHLLTLSLKSNGLDKLITYTGKAIRNNGMLVTNNAIQYSTLIEIIQQISMSEDDDIFKDTEKYIKQHTNNNTPPSEFYGYKNKQDFANQIYSDVSNWRFIYYKNIFHTNIVHDSSIIQSSCYNYIYGIYWTYAYYKKQNYDNTWYYPYSYPPTVKDIANYSICNPSPTMIEKTIDLSSDMQLMIVLPKESKKLINKKYVKFMEDDTMGMYHYYPTTYKIHTYLKRHLWECEPVLPTINVDYIVIHIK